jgi:hypothetical protein
MEEEILNIDYHVKRMVLKALNKSDTVGEAAALLGVTKRTVFNKIDDYGILFNKESGEYVLPECEGILVS